MTFIQTRPFRKALARLGQKKQAAVEAAIQQFQADRLDPNLRDHALKGKIKRLRTFSAGWDLRVIYREEGGFITIILLDADTHTQVY
ncbi:MAG: type II toxin-antitoxin system YafQ family toxin [Verrucomicrobiota bacterium]|jgi:mRNA-degrading endonuclease YafQ of YafQ-DinJ toxin-antitoxin module